MDFWSPSTKAQQAVKVRVSLQPDPADARVQSVKKTKKNQTKQPPKNKLNISSSGLMGGAGRESNLNPVKALV